MIIIAIICSWTYCNQFYDDSWALIIGINEYDNVSKLYYAVKDAELIQEILVKDFDFPIGNISIIKNEQATKLLKEFFNRSMILRKELEIYNSLNTTRVEEKVQFFEKIIVEAKKQYLNLDHKLVFEKQTKIINKINKFFGSDVWAAYIPSFKKLATINQIITITIHVKENRR